MKKKVLILLILCSISLSPYLFSIDYSSVLGFNGNYRENSWVPLIIRISNNEQSISGKLIVETANSSTTTEQFRQYMKPAELPGGSVKEFSFVIPIGHHNKTITYYLEDEGTRLFEEIIELKQLGIRKNFVLGVSPYPDLGFLNNHPKLADRTISYPHIDNLPRNSNGYNSVDILSIHREMLDKLSNDQFHALSGWINKGGVLIAWGGKSPSPSIWDILPSEISGLKKADSGELLKVIDPLFDKNVSLLLNITKTPEHNKLIHKNDLDLISYRRSGMGTVFFVSFDYSGDLRNWKGLNNIWDMVFTSIPLNKPFQQQIEDEITIDEYISIFDDSGYTYIERINVALILFLSASATASILIFVRLRRKSRNIHFYIGGLMGFLFLLSVFTFITLFNKNFRKDSFVISVNILHHYTNSDKAILYKDIFIGSTGKTSSDIMIKNDTLSLIRPNNIENRYVLQTPEISINHIEIDNWSSEIIRMEGSSDPVLSVSIYNNEDDTYLMSVKNISEYFIRDSFLFFNGKLIGTGNLLAGNIIELKVDCDTNIRDIDRDSDFNSASLLKRVAKQYIDSFDNKGVLLFCGFMSDEINPLSFSNTTWSKKTANLVTFSVTTEEINCEKPAF